MGTASYAQSSFLGGEWSSFAQGRFDRQDYRTAMNVCFNAFPLEEGAWTRRPGSRFMGTTYHGKAGRLLPFAFSQDAAHQLEFTDGKLRIFGPDDSGPMRIVLRNNDQQQVVSISSDTPAVVTTTTPADGTTADVFFNFDKTLPSAFCPLLRNTVFRVGSVTANTFTLFDAITNAPIDGSTLGWVTQPGVTVSHILELTSPYTGTTWENLRLVQAERQAFMLLNTVSPYVLTAVKPPQMNQFADFTFDKATFLDGPYLDPIPGLIATPSGGTEGVISLAIAYESYSPTTVYNQSDVVNYGGTNYTSLSSGNINHQPDISPLSWTSGPDGSPFQFQATDVGRSVRLFSEPLMWDAGTSYSIGDLVKYNDAYYQALTAGSGQTPDTSASAWGVSTSAASWTWGTIVQVTDATDVNVSIAGPPLQYENPINVWRLGAYSDTTGYPTCGVYHEGRLWLAGAVGNRIDGSAVDPLINNTINFAPTGADGTVADNNAITYTFNATEVNTIFWMKSTAQGIVCGTQGGEWLIQASAINDPITPTSIQAHRVTQYGGANVEAKDTNLTMVFVQRHGRKLLEYFADVFSGRFSAPNLAQDAGHITSAGLLELAYQRERSPIIWTRDTDGALAGLTYKRESLMSSQGPAFKGWHRHELGSGRTVTSISSGPSANGNLDALSMITLDSSTGIYHVEQFMDVFDEDEFLTAAWFVDDAIVPSGGSVSSDQKTLTLYGLHHLEGKTVSAFVCGLDAGDATVTGGQITLTFKDGIEGLFSLDYLIQKSGGVFSNSTDAFDMTTYIDGATGTPASIQVPVVVGFTYNSDGQQLRPIIPQDTGAQNGPALGKSRRIQMAAALLVNTIGISFGTDFNHLHAAKLTTFGGKNLPADQMYTGVWQDTIDDQSSFDSMLCWRVSRPYPAVVAATTPFIQTQDR